MQISKRLMAVANLVAPGEVLADIGTDHAYIPIYLIKENKIKSALAMDVRQGPLQRAAEHIRAYNLEEKIQTRLSDGFSSFHDGEADRIVIAGMGGALMMRILDAGKEKLRSGCELVLQPQSELRQFREWITQNGFMILSEDMVLEDGKYYPMMKVRFLGEKQEPLTEIEKRFGPYLMKERHSVLKEYLKKEMEKLNHLLEQLWNQDGEGAKQRRNEIKQELEFARQAYTYFL